MDGAANFERSSSLWSPEVAIGRRFWFVASIFTVLLITQTLGFLLLGTGRNGLGFVLMILVLHSLVALTCCWTAFLRARGIASMFWFLFVVTMLVLLVPTVFQTYDTIFGISRCRIPLATSSTVFTALRYS